jgi:predicted alpha-1,6-mannanase (GH76 family)
MSRRRSRHFTLHQGKPCAANSWHRAELPTTADTTIRVESDGGSVSWRRVDRDHIEFSVTAPAALVVATVYNHGA